MELRTVVELERLAGEPLDVLVNGTLIAHGEVVMVNEKPAHVGEEEAFNSKASKGGGEPKESFVSRVATLFKSPLMTLVCILSGSLYGVRTLFLLYA